MHVRLSDLACIEVVTQVIKDPLQPKVRLLEARLFAFINLAIRSRWWIRQRKRDQNTGTAQIGIV
jgi:hypothetical protein